MNRRKVIAGLIANKPKKYKQFIINKRLEGMSSVEVEEEYGVPRSTVSAWLSHYTRGTYKNGNDKGGDQSSGSE